MRIGGRAIREGVFARVQTHAAISFGSRLLLNEKCGVFVSFTLMQLRKFEVLLLLLLKHSSY